MKKKLESLVHTGSKTPGGVPILRVEPEGRRCRCRKRQYEMGAFKGYFLRARGVEFSFGSLCPGCQRTCMLPSDIKHGDEFVVEA